MNRFTLDGWAALADDLDKVRRMMAAGPGPLALPAPELPPRPVLPGQSERIHPRELRTRKRRQTIEPRTAPGRDGRSTTDRAASAQLESVLGQFPGRKDNI